VAAGARLSAAFRGEPTRQFDQSLRVNQHTLAACIRLPGLATRPLTIYSEPVYLYTLGASSSLAWSLFPVP
jgi:hypothetical protein